jgi:hypothetical protein
MVDQTSVRAFGRNQMARLSIERRDADELSGAMGYVNLYHYTLRIWCF